MTDIILKLYSEVQAFKDDLRPKYIIPTLLKNETITVAEKCEILAKEKPPDQVEVLLTILKQKLPGQLKNFVKALEKDEDGCHPYPWLAKKFETTCDINDKVYQILVNGNVPFSINHFLPRDEKITEIRDSLLKASSKRRHWVVLHGPIGSGKSVLAAEALRDNYIIEEHFINGVYWLSIGSARDDDAIKFKLIKLMKLMDIKSEIQQDDRAEDLTRLLRKEIGRKRMLLILDDVFFSEVIKAFDIGCPILVTTKNLGILDKYTDFFSDVPCKYTLKEGEILYILSKYVNCEINQLPSVVNSICVKCQGSPLVSSLIGSYMADIGNNIKMWEHLNNKLEVKGTSTLRKRWKSGEMEFGQIINLCLEPIQYLKDYYLDFLIFSKDVPVSHQVLEIFWNKRDYEVLNIMNQLKKRCFVDMDMSKEDEYDLSYSSHNLYLDVLSEEVGAKEIQNRHKKLVERILELCSLSDGKYDWTKLPKNYIPYTIGYHLYKAGEYELLKSLYTDLKFLDQIIRSIEQHSKNTGVWHVTSEYCHYENCFENEEVIRFESFLRRNTFALTDTNNDIIQLALFEPTDSIVYAKAKDYAEEMNEGKYYDWSNRSESNYGLFNCKSKLAFEGMKHAVFNHDAALVASVGETFAEVWMTSVTEVSQRLHGHTDVINYCSFNSKGDYLATASADKIVRVFQIGESLTSSGDYSRKRYSNPNLLQNKNSPLNFSPKLDNLKIMFTEHEEQVVCCSFSPDDHFIISSDVVGKSIVWEVGTENDEQPWTIKWVKHHEKAYVCFSRFSNDGKTFGVAVYDSIKLWDFETGDLKRILHHDNYFIKAFIFTPNDSHILSVYDNIIKKWNMENKTEKSIIEACPKKSFIICSCCMSSDGDFIACGTSAPSVIIFGAQSKNLVAFFQGHDDVVINVMFSKDNKKLLSVSSTQCIIHDTSELTDTPQCAFEGNLSVQSQNNEQEIMVASSVVFNTLEVREGLDGHLISKSKSENENITFCSLSNNCSEVIYGTKNGSVKVFNIASKRTLELQPKHKDQVNYILHSKNNSTFFTCSADKTIKVWEDNFNVMTLNGHRDGVIMCVEFNKSNKLLSCSKDGSLRVWDISPKSSVHQSIKHLSLMEGHGNQDVTFCDVSSNDVYLASCSVDGTVKIWKSENGEIVKKFHPETEDYNRSVRCCRFSTSGEFLIVGLDNGKVFFCHLLGNQGSKVLVNRHNSVVHKIMMVSKNCVTTDRPLFLSLSSNIQLWGHKGQPLHTIALPSSCLGAVPCIWTSDNFDIIVVILNSILYILKRI